ncbi:MAG: hypothetical protein AAB511_03995 [Patescibacteria group bacterium]
MKKNTKWDKLVEALRKEPHLLQKRITPAKLAELHAARRAFTKTLGGYENIVAFVALWDTADPNWFEIGTIWIHPEKRGTFSCRDLLKTAYENRPVGSATFLVTLNTRVAFKAVDMGWQIQKGDNWDMVPFWKRVVEPWDRYDSNSQIAAPGRLLYRVD